VEQELPTLPEHLNLLPVFSGVRVAHYLLFCVIFCRLLFFLLSFLFCPFSVLLRITASDFPFGVFKRLLKKNRKGNCQMKKGVRSEQYSANHYTEN
jgi:hypothetical protein